MTVRRILIVGMAAAAIAPSAAAGAAHDNVGPALETLRAQDRRALSIGWRLAQASADLCADARPGLGWTLHNLDQYRPGLRDAATAVFGLRPGEVGVLALAPDGPAAIAGVREDDVVMTIGPVRMDGPAAVSAAADHAPLAARLQQIEAAMTAGPLAVSVRRGGRVLDMVVQPRLHCAWPVQVEPSNRFYAASDGARIAVSSALAAFARRDNDLAFVVAHEMGHNLRRPAGTGDRLRSRTREIEADRIGLILTARAGYDTAGAGAFMSALWRRAGTPLPWLSAHPPAAERAAALDRLHVWIEAEKTAGRPLRP